MKFLFAGLAAVMILACVSADAEAGKKMQQPLIPYRDFAGPVELPEDHPDYREHGFLQASPADTFCLVWFDFEGKDWQGWTVNDNTAQVDTFFHIDDFAGLGGGDFGRLVPIEGTKSAWCGTRPGDDFYLCSWLNIPGYGDSWDQVLVSDPFPFTNPLEFSYHGVFDSEVGWDFTYVEYSSGEDWHVLGTYDGVLDTVATHTLLLPVASTKLRFHFVSDGVISDQDGLYNTDGACIIDSITVRDAHGVIHFEDFESVPSGAMSTDFWSCDLGHPGFGSYTGLADNLQDKDPCGRNFTSQIIFFEGSPWMSADYPGMPVTPFCAYGGGSPVICQNVSVISPVIQMERYSTACDEVQDADIPAAALPDLGGTVLRFSVYRDLPLSNLVFYVWEIQSLDDGCPGDWMSRHYGYFGSEREYLEISLGISDLAGPHPIRIKFEVWDMCDAWGWNECYYHTPSPYFDNVRLYRYATVGPQWSYRAMDLFQDNFPSTDDIESFVRADMASDIAPGDEYGRIDPGDSIVVGCASWTGGGLDTLGTGEARVYCHVNVSFLGTDGKPDLFGPQLAGTYGSYASGDGDWTVLLMNPAATSAGNVAPGKYCIDLNDSLFTRGYMIEYYFKAYDLEGNSTTLPEGAETMAPYAYPSARSSNLFEFTCLPLLVQPGTTLYVDDFDGRGTFQGLVQAYYDPAFDAICADDSMIPDRYDVNQPSSIVGNCLGSRARLAHLQAAYHYILWDSGDLENGTIIVPEVEGAKSDDVGLLLGWLDSLSIDRGGLVIMGDNIATDLRYSSDGRVLMEDWCGTSRVHSSFYEMTGGFSGGGIVNPLLTGVAGTAFEGQQFYLSGGCPGIDDFDVLGPFGNGFCALEYPEYGGNSGCAAVLSSRVNSMGADVRLEWMGFSFMHIRNAVNGTLARNEFLYAAMRYWLHGPGGSTDITEGDVPAVTSLADNFPNPFNPSTRLKFSLAKNGHVSMRIYDVSGRLVRILIDEVQDAGSHEAVWDGTNDGGRSTASGIYFCRMEAPGYERTLKMVLLR